MPARRKNSLSHGIKYVANPYEKPPPLKLSPRHREHRSKKNRTYRKQYNNLRVYKQEYRALIEQDLDEQIKDLET